MAVVVKDKFDIGQLLLNYNLITHDQLEKAKGESIERKVDIRKVLIESKYTTEAAINYVLSGYLDLPYVHPSPQTVDSDAVKSIPMEILEKYKMVPIIRVGNELNLVMADPMDEEAIREAKAITGCSVNVSIGLTEEILNLIEYIFKKEIPQIPKPAKEEVVADTSGVVFVYQYLIEALDEGATHIYIEPLGGQINISYKKTDGTLEKRKPQPLSLYPAVCARLKVMAGMDIEKKGIFQEKHLITTVGDKEVYLLMSVLPSIQGDCWTIKIIEKVGICPKLEDLGILDKLLPQIKEVINQNSGLAIITGPSGSGRTTIAYSLLSEADSRKKVVTVEKVVSYQNNGFIQIESSGVQALDAALTQGADIVMLEDISEPQILNRCFNAVLGGRLILGQMERPDVLDLLDYLVGIGISPSLIASTLSMVIAQKKIRLLCNYCKEAYPPPPELNLGDIYIYRAKGCEKCNLTGYQGTSYIYEVLILNERLKEMLIQEKGFREIEEESYQYGFYSLKKTLKEKLISGIISLEEVV